MQHQHMAPNALHLSIHKEINTYLNCGEMLMFASFQHNYHRLRPQTSVLSQHTKMYTNSIRKVSLCESIKMSLRQWRPTAHTLSHPFESNTMQPLTYGWYELQYVAPVQGISSNFSLIWWKMSFSVHISKIRSLNSFHCETLYWCPI